MKKKKKKSMVFCYVGWSTGNFKKAKLKKGEINYLSTQKNTDCQEKKIYHFFNTH